ncbi:MAG: MBL fold metallo-hydrolase, partial [Chloroflexota bacterium]
MSVPDHLEISQIVAGPLETNAFIVVEPETRQAMIVDAPPDSLATIEAEVERLQATPVVLVITHGHWDHIGDAAAIKEQFEIPLLVHELDRPKLENPGQDGIAPAKVDRVIGEGDVVELGELRFQVMHTPGHARGQVSLYEEEQSIMLGGDTLFPGGYGRVDIPDASAEETVATIRRLLELPDSVTVLP